MSPFGRRLVDLACRLLEPEDRDAVHGDIAESGESTVQALRDVAGVVVRRQAQLLKPAQPWFAMLALIAALLSGVLVQVDRSLFFQLRTFSHHGVHQDTGLSLSEDIFVFATMSLALFAWVWTSGFVLASLSGRAIWFTGPLFYLMVLNWPLLVRLVTGHLSFGRAPLMLIVLNTLVPDSIVRVLFVLVAVWGARKGLRRRTLEFHRVVLLAVAVACLTGLATWTSGWYVTAHELWSGGVWREVGIPWYTRLGRFTVMCWPLAYMLVTANRMRRRAIATN